MASAMMRARSDTVQACPLCMHRRWVQAWGAILQGLVAGDKKCCAAMGLDGTFRQCPAARTGPATGAHVRTRSQQLHGTGAPMGGVPAQRRRLRTIYASVGACLVSRPSADAHPLEARLAPVDPG